MMIRICKDCGEEKPLTIKFFRQGKTLTTFRWQCHICRNARIVELRNALKISDLKLYEKRMEYQRQYCRQSFYEDKKDMIRHCKKCLLDKTYADFGAGKTICQQCFNEEMRMRHKEDEEYHSKRQQKDIKHYANNKEKQCAEGRAYNRTPKGKFAMAKRIAKRRDIDWNLTPEQYVKLTAPKCFYCSYRLGKPTEAGVGLDRKDNDYGYSENNVLSCCGTCNKLRGNWLTVEETSVAVNAILRFRETNHSDTAEQHLPPIEGELVNSSP